MFKTNPFAVPWQIEASCQTVNGGISEDDWVGLWLRHFNLNPKHAFRDLYYLGYQGKMKDALTPVIVRTRDIAMIQKRRHFTV